MKSSYLTSTAAIAINDAKAGPKNRVVYVDKVIATEIRRNRERRRADIVTLGQSA